MAAPATPNNLIVQQGNGQVYLSWDLGAGATSYQVQRSTDNVSFSVLASPATNSYLDLAVTAGSQYYYKVAATNASGDSPYTASQGVVPTLTGQMSLGQARLLALQEADKVNSSFVSVPELNTYINQSYFELYDLLVTVYEDYYLASPVLIQMDGQNQQYTLPNGSNTFLNQAGSTVTPPALYKLMGVDCGLALNNNAWVNINKFDFVDRNNYVYPNVTSTFLGVFNMRYRLLGNTIMFIPLPSSGQYIRLWYVPRLSWLLQDTDLLDGVSGWTEYVVVDAAIKILEKEESDTTALQARKAMLRQRIEESAMNRDAGMPDTISASRSDRSNGDGGWGSMGGW